MSHSRKGNEKAFGLFTEVAEPCASNVTKKETVSILTNANSALMFAVIMNIVKIPRPGLRILYSKNDIQRKF